MGSVIEDFERLWLSLPNPVLAIDAEGYPRQINDAAEAFLAMSRRRMSRKPLSEHAGQGSRVLDLISRTSGGAVALSEYNVEFNWPDTPGRWVDLHAVPLGDGAVLITIHPRANAERMGRQMGSRDAARSVVGMASMLAHEIKNPLAGISGAAQLLEMSAAEEDREMAQLIQEEADRITELVTRVEAFGDMGLGRRKPVNIHDVLDRAAKAAKAGFAEHVRFVESYDPSLPPTFGDADQLMQVMQNLLKNAAEAAPPVGGVIMLKTSYRAGLKVRSGGASESLPLQIEISDNGQGVPEELLPHLFEPFVTSKSTGSGLGLALVSKIIADHGGVISCDSHPGFTTFRILLPVSDADVGDDMLQAGQENAA
ncbi:MAG: ATP-binding protein [Pseudomonadota bacterium]